MDHDTVAAYLDRIGVTAFSVCDTAGLRALHRAHQLTVPFENLSIHLAEPISLDERDLAHKIVRRRRGGFCYELNGTFALLLEALGAQVSRVAARVYGESMFPYAQQHNGNIPPELAPGIRTGALKMIVFEELVYQEALRRKMTVSPERLNSAEAGFSQAVRHAPGVSAVSQHGVSGSQQQLREKIKRSLLIDQLLKAEVDKKSTVSPAELKAYYDKNPTRFNQPEAFAFQTITILPPDNPTPAC